MLYKGTPTLFVDGKPNAGFCYMTYNFKPDHFQQFGEIGVDLLSFSTTSDSSFYFSMPDTWTGPDSYDYSEVDRRFKTVVEATPKAKIFPRIYICSPPWWDEMYKSELMVFEDGIIDPKFVPSPHDPLKKSVPSFASKKWRDDAAENIRRFVEHVRAQPYAKNIIGYQLASGSTEEWLYWNFEQGPVADFSRPQLNAFRLWLRDKYKTQSALRRAWNDPELNFKNAAIPTQTERENGDYFMFRDPAKSQRVIDYMQFHSWIVQDMITYLARAAKEACNYESLVGSFYGYTLHARGQYQRILDSYQEQGHFALGELLKSPHIDFLSSPTQYEFREVGTGYSVFMSPQKSIQLHKKLWMDENDYRTHLVSRDAGYGRTINFKETRANQLRQLSNELTHATGAWWFDMGGGWYDSAEMLELIRKLNAIAERSIEFDRRSSAEIAVVVDEYSNFMMRSDKRLSIPLIYYQMLPLGKIGAPFDYILQDDLELAGPYKFYIFLNAFHVSKKQREMIGRLPDRGAKALLWIYAPGYVGETLDIEGTYALTGLRLATLEGEGQLQVAINAKGANYLTGLKEAETYGIQEGGARNLVGPIFYGDDPSAEVLGLLYGHDLPGLITKEVKGVQVYYSAAPQISSPVLRAIATNAGVHIYNYRDDVLYANNSFIALHTATAGKRKIMFPKKTSLYDVYREREIARDVRQAIVDLPLRETFLYFRGTKDQWENNKQE